nr:ABC transporter permease [Halothermothrix orenii]
MNPVSYTVIDRASKEEQSGHFLGIVIPYFVIISIFVGAMNVGINITAGEKEKGTLSTLLVTQLTRSEVVTGKLITLIIISTFSAILNIVGIVFAYNFAFRATGSELDLVVSMSGGWLIQMLVLLVLLAFIISGIVMLAGSFARNIKEGNSYVMPAYMAVILIGVMSMSGAFSISTPMYLIPILNVIFMLQDVLSLNAEAINFWMTVISSSIFGFLLNYMSVRLFQRESIIFRT